MLGSGMPTSSPGSPYRDQRPSLPEPSEPEERRVFTYPRSRIVLAAVIMAPGVLIGLSGAREMASKGSYIWALLWLALSVFSGSLVWSLGRVRLVITPKHFEVTGLWGKTVIGEPSEFIGYDCNEVRNSWDLLRRDDLSIVRVPWFTHGGTGPDEVAVRNWIDQHFPSVYFWCLGSIKRDSQMAEQRTLRVLEDTHYEKSEMLDRKVDVRLAAAARSAWRYRYGRARPALQRHLLELPPYSIARQYVVDALRRLGTAESVEALLEALQRGVGQRGPIARAVTELATSDHRQVLEALRKDDDPFVRHHAERSLRRIATRDVKARRRTRSPSR